MANSEERREVARRLREYANDELKDGSLLKTLKDVTGAGSWRYVLDALADLIDPVGQVVDNGVDSFCSECDYVLDPDEVIEAKYCPGCGVRLVVDDE